MIDFSIKIIPILLTTIGLFFTIYITIIRKNHKKPKIKVSIPYTTLTSIFSYNFKNVKPTIFYIFDKEQNSNPIICVPILISNTGSLPCTDLLIRVEFPIQFSYVNTVFIGDQNKSLSITQIKSQSLINEIEYVELGDTAQITYKIEKLRVGEENVIIHYMRAEEYLKVRTEKETDTVNEDAKAIYSKRFNNLSKVLSCVELYVGIFSPDFKKMEKKLSIISLNCKGNAELDNTIKEMIITSWGDYRPSPGIYWTDQFLWFLNRKRYNIKGLIRKQNGECIFSDLTFSDLTNEDQNVKLNKIKYPKIRSIKFHVPPWGFFGKRFDLSIYALRIYKKKEHNK